MAQISASDVSKLRKATNAGMMDCKKALQEAEGDFDKAVDIIRKKGQAMASKRADREASEGAILAKVSSDATIGGVLSLNCETDFVAKNEDFVKLAATILDSAIESKVTDIESLKQLQIDGKTVESIIVEQIGVIGEKIELSEYALVEAAQVVPYIHPGNKLATLVGFNKQTTEQVAKDIAMQVAAMAPVAIDKEDVAQEVVDK